MTDQSQLEKLNMLRDVVDAYGADPARWQQAQREELEDFAMSDPMARAVMDEALALDRLLAVSDESSQRDVSFGLAQRIMQAADETPQDGGVLNEGQRNDATDARPQRETGGASIHQIAAFKSDTPKQRARTSWAAGVMVAASMAASLAFGVYLGGTTSVAAPIGQVIASLEPRLVGGTVGDSSGESEDVFDSEEPDEESVL